MSFWKQVWASRPWPLSLIRKRRVPLDPPLVFEPCKGTVVYGTGGHTWEFEYDDSAATIVNGMETVTLPSEYPHWHLPDDPFDPTDWLGGLTEEQIDDALRLIYQDNWYQFLNWPEPNLPPINLDRFGSAYDEKEIVHADDE